MKKVVTLFFLFILINIVVSGSNMNYEPFYILEAIMIPIENNVIVLSHLILNYLIALVIIYEFVSTCCNIFAMYPFIASRTSYKGVLKLYIIESLKQLTIILLTKLVADLLINNISDIFNLQILIKIYISIIITSILWLIIIFLFYTLFQNEKRTLFSILAIAFISQFLALKNSYFGIVSMTNINFYSNFKIMIIAKMIFVIISLIVAGYIFNKKEFIGGDRND